MECKNRSQDRPSTTTTRSQDAQTRATWSKPAIREISCGLEINCYASSTGRR